MEPDFKKIRLCENLVVPPQPTNSKTIKKEGFDTLEGFEHLEHLEGLENLKQLEVNNSKVFDILKGMKNLKVLKI